MDIKIIISIGELLDKITILQIKTENISDEQKLANINHELQLLEKFWHDADCDKSLIEHELAQLKQVNQKLWQIEDEIRIKELKQNFDSEFIELARSVYFTNDVRADLKKQINIKLKSGVVEEKSYADYTQT